MLIPALIATVPISFSSTRDLAGAPHAEQPPPRVTSTTPELCDQTVDPALRELRIVFDCDMDHAAHSLCGGGPSFPRLRGKVRWEGPRVAVVPIELDPDHEYALSVNCESATNFHSADGTPVEPFPIRFRTRAAGESGAKVAPPPTPEQQRESVEQLRRAVRDRYSYRDLRNIDWDKAFAEHAASLENAPTRAAFALEAGRLLAVSADVHVGVRIGECAFPCFRAGVQPNVNFRTLPRMVPEWKPRGSAVITGRFQDGTGYIAILACPSDPKALQPAINTLTELAGAKGLIIDLRANGGGSEAPLRNFAGCFLEAPAVYSINDFRDPSSASGFGPKLERTVKPSEPAWRERVAVLIGPAVVSSAESLTLMLRANPRARLFGSPTRGSSGNPRPLELSNGVSVLLPSWRDFLPDGTLLEGRGISPDVRVDATSRELEQKDPVLDAALAWLRKAR